TRAHLRNHRFQVQPAGVQGLAQNGGPGADLLELLQLFDAADTAGGGDVQAPDLRQLPVEVQVCAGLRPVPADIRVDDGFHAGVPETPAEVHAALGGELLPPADGHIAVPGVHPHDDLVAVLPGHPLCEIKVLHRDGAQDAPAHPQVQVLADAVLGADA